MEQFKLDDANSPNSKKDKNDFGQPDFSGGPNFGQPEDWDNPSDSWFSRYGSTVVLPIIAILVLAGGIYLYATQKSEPGTIEEAAESLNGEEISLIEEETETTEESAEAIGESETAQETEIEVIIPEPKKTQDTITETAIRGNGVTHLARRALKTYLSDNPNKASELTNEHKIYIEDYLKDQTGPRPIHVSDELSFEKDSIQEAIDASLTLTENQLKNLEKYSALVAW